MCCSALDGGAAACAPSKGGGYSLLAPAQPGKGTGGAAAPAAAAASTCHHSVLQRVGQSRPVRRAPALHMHSPLLQACPAHSHAWPRQVLPWVLQPLTLPALLPSIAKQPTQHTRLHSPGSALAPSICTSNADIAQNLQLKPPRLGAPAGQLGSRATRLGAAPLQRRWRRLRRTCHMQAGRLSLLSGLLTCCGPVLLLWGGTSHAGPNPAGPLLFILALTPWGQACCRCSIGARPG